MFNWIFSKEKYVYCVYGIKKLECFDKYCGHEQEFLMGIYTTSTHANRVMHNLNDKYQLSTSNFKSIYNSKDYFKTFYVVKVLIDKKIPVSITIKK